MNILAHLKVTCLYPCGHKVCATLHSPVALGGFDAVVSKFGVFLNTGEKKKLHKKKNIGFSIFFVIFYQNESTSLLQRNTNNSKET